MPESVTVPSTLSGTAAEMWRTTFLSAYEGTCGEREDRDECAAKVAWSQVKKKHRKGDDGQWVAKASDPTTGPISSIVDPGGAPPGLGTGFDVAPPDGLKGTKGQRWRAAFIKALQEECRNSDKPVECARAKANAAVGLQERSMEYNDYPKQYIERRKFDDETRRAMAEKGTAMSDGSFPIANIEDVTFALRSLGNKNVPRAEVYAHIRKCAEALGCDNETAISETLTAWDRYLERSELRTRANEGDMGLIERMSDQAIIRPEHISNMVWNKMPPSQKTVGAEARNRIIERNYAQAVEDAQLINGWKAEINHHNMTEHIFSKYLPTDAGPVLVRAIMVRKPDEYIWSLEPVSTFASGSVLKDLGPEKLRHV